MIPSKSEFFQEGTLRICSSLDFGEALESFFRYLVEVLPVEGVFVNIYEEQRKEMRTIASVTLKRGLRRNLITPLTAEAVDFLEEVRGQRTWQPSLLKDHETHLMTRLEAPILGYGGRALMGQPLNIAESYFGMLILSAGEGVEFSETHLRLFEGMSKPFAIALANALAYEKMVELKDRLKEDNRTLKEELRQKAGARVIGEEGGLKNLMEMVRQVAPCGNTVLLLGETGVGKEVIANVLHHSSSRKDGPFIKVNCGAIPETLIDSELFGYEKGAFSGAIAAKEGRFERAHGGTIFLDEIGELPPPAQIRLLRVLQEREVERVGGSRSIPVDIRVIAATHRNLEAMIAKGDFREDLWFRLNVFPLTIPPLRQRREDIPDLVRHFLCLKSRELGFRTPPYLASGAMERLVEYRWQGNVRELENVIEREIIRSNGRSLSFGCLVMPSRAQDDDPCLVAAEGSLASLDEAIVVHMRNALREAGGKIHGPGGAAELIGLNPNTFRSKMRKLGIAFGR